MERYTLETLEIVRITVSRVKDADLTDLECDAPLNLDSIGRITLIAELENEFNMEFSGDDLQPEVFETLASLAELIDRRKT